MIEKFEAALKLPEPVHKLRNLLVQLRAEGVSKEILLAELETLRARLRSENNEADEDSVMDVMDFLVGNCSSFMRID